MAKLKDKPYPPVVLDLMAAKTAVLLKARAFADMGLVETAPPLWASAAGYEERLAPMLEALGRDLEAALHRVSAASCYQKAGEPGRAVNLYRAALAGPLHETTRRDVEGWLAQCLAELPSLAGASG